MKNGSGALSRFTVLDLTRVRAGPTCVRQFADWGANVIKIESPDGSADFAARHDPDFQNLHRNKRSITLNLKTPEGLAVLKQLVARADVLVENYRPDVKDRLGIDYESLKKVNKRLVYTSISGFGQDGPYRERPGVDQIAQGMGGLMSITGAPGKGPMRVGIAIADLSAGLLAAVGTMTALLEREVSGEGQWVHTSLLEAQIFMLDFQAARYLMKQEVAGQVGNDHPTSVPTGTFRTRDGYINIAPTPPMWKKFCATLGLNIAEDPDFATPPARRKNRDRLAEAVEKVTLKETNATWIDRFNKAGVPCGPIYSIDQTFADPQVKHLGMAETVKSGKLGEIPLVAQPVNLSRTDSQLVAGAPEAGEQTDEILEWLGYSKDTIADFHQREIV
jgi:crotonobetainyl-CoA:carnitine CoA-transferase CaiB-like acyl-CoA transferase